MAKEFGFAHNSPTEPLDGQPYEPIAPPDFMADANRPAQPTPPAQDTPDRLPDSRPAEPTPPPNRPRNAPNSPQRGTPRAKPIASSPHNHSNEKESRRSQTVARAAPLDSGPVVTPTVPTVAFQTTENAPDSDDAEPADELAEVAIRCAPPWLISAIFHMLVLIVLALIMIPQWIERRIDLNAEFTYAEQEGEQLEFDSPLTGMNEDALEEPLDTPLDLPRVEDPFAAPPDVQIVPDAALAASRENAPVVGYALMGREKGSKAALLRAYGGNATTQAAVELALEWLVRNQRNDGSWSLQGPYSHGAQYENREAATAMALLAFQGNGCTHRKGDHQEVVARGWYWLLKQQDDNGNFFRDGGFNHAFYTQGQCTIAVCEMYGMTQDAQFRAPAEKAVQYLLDSQSPQGGWRYSPNADSDLSVTGWIVMALQSAKMAGLEVPEENLEKVRRFLDNIAIDGGSRYPYQRGREATLAMTAEGLLCRQYLGWERSNPHMAEGLDWITQRENLISYTDNRDVYYWYYATQACHHMEGEYWKRWNEVMRQAVPEQQVKSGPEAGSWDPTKPSRDTYEHEGGRLYVTCMSVYMLEVYYRHLPLYSNVFHYLQGTTQ